MLNYLYRKYVIYLACKYYIYSPCDNRMLIILIIFQMDKNSFILLYKDNNKNEFLKNYLFLYNSFLF